MTHIQHQNFYHFKVMNIFFRKDHGIETDPREEFAFPIKLTVLIWIGKIFLIVKALKILRNDSLPAKYSL